MNPLARWLAHQPDGTAAKARLSAQSGIRWQSIHLIACNRQVPRPETAAAIERGTSGEVLAADLFHWFAEHPRVPKETTAAAAVNGERATSAENAA